MATVKATQRRAQTGLAAGKGEASNVKVAVATIELAAAASATIIDFDTLIPTTARILGSSTLYADDLATSGSPTLDLGLTAVNSNITTDDDCLTDGLAVSSALTGSKIIKDAANYGKRAWEYVNGQTTDPGGLLKLTGVIRDAATTATGTITAELYYTLD